MSSSPTHKMKGRKSCYMLLSSLALLSCVLVMVRTHSRVLRTSEPANYERRFSSSWWTPSPQVLRSRSGQKTDKNDAISPIAVSAKAARLTRDQSSTYADALPTLNETRDSRRGSTLVDANASFPVETRFEMNGAKQVSAHDGQEARAQPQLHAQGAEKKTSGAPFVEPDEPLNVVVLYPDDWRYDTIENPMVHTPFLSRIASQLGLQFARNFVTTSICWVSRATLFTGEYASRHKSFRLRSPVPFYARWNDTWVGRLRRAGYHVGLSGKWQFEDNNQDFVKSAFDWVLLSGGHWGAWNNRRMHMSQVHAHEAIEFLRTRPRDKNFAMTVAFYPPKAVGESNEPGVQWSPLPKVRKMYDNVTIPLPHDPNGTHMLPPQASGPATLGRGRWRERFQGDERYQASMKNYYALVTQVDEAMRRIVEELEHQGVLNKTLVIITADNGMFLGDHGLAGKWYPYEASIRVPLLVLDPRMPPEKRGTIDYESFTLNVDLAATIMAAAQVPAHASVQGRDFTELYRPSAQAKLQKEPWRTEFLYEFPSVVGIAPSSALVTHQYKYLEWPPHERWNQSVAQLFDRRDDVEELNDLLRGSPTAEIQQIAAELKVRHDQYAANTA